MSPPSDPQPHQRRAIHVDGVVQGVGFRPFIYGLAARYGLTGWVLNDSSGVDIEVQGPPAGLDAFQAAISSEAPRLARIDHLSASPAEADPAERAFTIRHSQTGAGSSLIAPDVATCPDCLAEIFDPADRRYRYPFTNCTNCGPRYTIIQAMPYDRPLTTMRGFTMCPQCQAEYENPLDRRFHAQPNACPTCGPRVRLLSPEGAALSVDGGPHPDDIARAAALLRDGRVVAIKGLGGFHLACDATSPAAVALLRERKRRPHKPFAVMLADLDQVRQHCLVSDEEAALLVSPAAPIVLLYRRPESTLALSVAPANPMLGVMLPNTPLHHLLLRDAGRPLVMTSGNRSDTPIEIDTERALKTLAGLADAFLAHDRPIHMRCDDAVWWVDRFAGAGDAARQPLRRSRGDAPYPLRLPWNAPRPILALGAEMKNTFCLLRGGDALMSQHIGEITSLESVEYLRAALDNLSQLFKVEPQVIACDLHPGYLVTRLARDLAEERGLPLVAVQHHHAHIAACLADHGQPGPVVGIALDGTGYGPDGAIWGGEVLITTLKDYRRVAHLEYLPLPGGDAAIQRPYRIAWGYLQAATGAIPDLPALAAFGAEERRVVSRQVERGLNCPLTSSCGRLFDAVAAMTGVCPVATFEAQAAIALELAARQADLAQASAYPFRIDGDGLIRLGALLEAVTADVRAGRRVEDIAACFHLTVAHMLAEAARHAGEQAGVKTAALSGGSFQNRLLLRLTREALRTAGFSVLSHQQVPANDGGLSLGQAVVALHAEP